MKREESHEHPPSRLTLLSGRRRRAGCTRRYDAARVLRRLLPLRVVVSLGVAFALIGAIVIAGVLLRHRHPSHPNATTATTATTRKGNANP